MLNEIKIFNYKCLSMKMAKDIIPHLCTIKHPHEYKEHCNNI